MDKQVHTLRTHQVRTAVWVADSGSCPAPIATHTSYHCPPPIATHTSNLSLTFQSHCDATVLLMSVELLYL